MSLRDVTALELVVGCGVIAVAMVALLVPRRLAAAVSFLIFGVLLSVLWALAGAPDVALAEAALGAGVTGVLFIEAVSRSRTPTPRDVAGPRPWLTALFTVGAAALLTLGLAPALWRAATPLEGATAGLSGAVTQALPQTGVEHAVTGVLLNLRSYDTFLEIVVLLVAVLAALAVGRPERITGATSSPAAPTPAATAVPAVPAVPPLQTGATALLVPALVLLAAWLLFAGSSRPGGAFQSGAVLAALVLLLHLAHRPVLPMGSTRVRVVAVAGVLAFVLVAAVGPLLGGAWLQLDPSWATPVIIVLESVLAVAIGASLALIALTLRQGSPQ
ncbi:hydrogenase subunit MbhD domain-containing protein [Ornithinimicrobium sufpigmenti]|uniref:hydrogenase subunit MbhD domain-containing protein n=1 Tax=Ornithinimicrobium sufpigmenti TaxID=2508882 RepID=UPI001035DF0E|nr:MULTISPECIES: hydrogenase subunit MbhD domain-containing protein [unclassified Ornithinimicrobium]